MAVVIQLASYPRPQQPSATAPRGQEAEILFYTGVRYERAPEAGVAERPAPRRRRSAATTLTGTKVARAKSVRQPA